MLILLNFIIRGSPTRSKDQITNHLKQVLILYQVLIDSAIEKNKPVHFHVGNFKCLG